jgi:hypothetical protein
MAAEDWNAYLLFTRFSSVDAAEFLDVLLRTADRLWKYSRAWLRRAVEDE